MVYENFKEQIIADLSREAEEHGGKLAVTTVPKINHTLTSMTYIEGGEESNNGLVARPNLYVELLSGQKIYFKGETEGQRALLEIVP